MDALTFVTLLKDFVPWDAIMTTAVLETLLLLAMFAGFFVVCALFDRKGGRSSRRK